MQVFVYLVRLPSHPWEERAIETVEEHPLHLLYWTEGELNRVFSGEFGWKKIGVFAVCALQYVSRTLVRLIVKAPNRAMADTMVKSFSWHLDAKKDNKKPYARKSSQMKFMLAANKVAVSKSLSSTNNKAVKN